jgi:RNA polymerase sigma factor (sigma-70 family)
MLQIYMNQVKKLYLNNEQQQELFRLWKETDDKKYYNTLFNSLLLDTAKYTIKIWGMRNTLIMDLIQEANDSLMRSLKHYDPSYNVPIFSYASRYVKGYTMRFYYYKNPTVKVPVLKGQTHKLTFCSLQNFVGENEKTNTFQDMLASEENLEDTVVSKISLEKLMQKIDSSRISERSKLILTKHFVDDMNYQEIGTELKLTRERVRQIVDTAKKSLTKHLNCTGYEHVA